MNKIKCIFTVLVPNIYILLYAYFLYLAQTYASSHYSAHYVFLVMILGNLVYGLILFFICKGSFNGSRSGSLKFILGVLIIPLIYLLSIIPGIDLTIISAYIISSIPYYFIFAGIYIGLFVYSLNQKKKQASDISD